MKRLINVFLVLLLVMGLFGCSEKTTTHTIDKLTIVIPSKYEFEEIETDVYDKCLYDGETDVALWVKHYDTEWLSDNGYSDFTLEDIGYNIGKGNEILSEGLDGDVYVKSYVAQEGDFDVFKYANIYQKSDGYWIIILDCLEKDKDTYQSQFDEWFKTVNIAD